jgi:dissimilatory sulfite reductase (desulfoviridin) alpha/beta subunit
MKWTKEAEEAVAKVPFFVRKRVGRRVEEEAAGSGSRIVTIEHVTTCKKRFLGNMEEEVQGCRVESCFGPTGCPNRAVKDDDLANKMEEILSRKDLKAFLKQKVSGPLKIHHEFQVTIADCPNACSRPQIADVGIIGVCLPATTEEPCSGCGACVDVCREGAISLGENGMTPDVDCDKCLSCGQCIAVCPTGTIGESKRGYRILVGGKLGRHPQLGKELAGIFTKEETLQVIEACIDYYMTHNRSGERFGEVVNRRGADELLIYVKDSPGRAR